MITAISGPILFLPADHVNNVAAGHFRPRSGGKRAADTTLIKCNKKSTFAIKNWLWEWWNQLTKMPEQAAEGFPPPSRQWIRQMRLARSLLPLDRSRCTLPSFNSSRDMLWQRHDPERDTACGETWWKSTITRKLTWNRLTVSGA